MRCGRPNWPGCSRSSAFIRRSAAAGSRGWRGRWMLFKPDGKDNAKIVDGRKPSLVSRLLRRMVSLTVLLVILGGLGYIGWYAFQPKGGGANPRGPRRRPAFAVAGAGGGPRRPRSPGFPRGPG